MKDVAGCCLSDSVSPRENSPGQSSIAYRIGTHGTFFAHMIDALGRTGVPDVQGARPLRALTTRSLDDGTIALCDAWAVALDVLTFYQERIANEGYLGTARERRSIVEIANSIGYEPGAGVAASTHLAFTVDTNAPGGTVRIPGGLGVMSVPRQDERPQAFETVEEIEARVEWNAMRPTLLGPHALETSTVYFQGAGTRLRIGDPVASILVNLPAISTAVVTAVVPRPEHDLLEVTFSQPIRVGLVGLVGIPIFTFRTRASLFGHAAPDPRTLSASSLVDLAVTGSGASREWTNITISLTVPLALDREYPEVVPGGYVLFRSGGTTVMRALTSAISVGMRDFTLAAKCTQITLQSVTAPAMFLDRRSTVVYVQSEALAVGMQPLDPDGAVPRDRIELDRTVEPMPVGRPLIVTGLDAATGEPVAEVAFVGEWRVSTDGLRSVLVLRESLAHAIVRKSLVVFGNVVLATHGASAAEVLGSGDAAAAYQTFALKQAPMTWVPAQTANGAESTLELRVDGVLWRRVDSLLDQGPNDRVYVLHTDDDGVAHVQFGDGIRGARLPPGAGNVVARYRTGIGLEGEVDANQLTLLLQRPLGLRAAINPARAMGADDRETADTARKNAPLTVLTLDRLVAVQDYEDFSRAFAGIGKAAATDLWNGKRAFVHVTVASASGEVFADEAPTLEALAASIDERNDPSHVVIISPHRARFFGVQLGVLRDPAYAPEALEAAVRAALAHAYGFAAREFGQPVTTTEIISVVHRVKGVEAVDIDDLFYVDGPPPPVPSVLPAARAAWDGTSMSRTELLLLAADSVGLTWMER